MGVIADGYDHLRAVGVSADRSVTITLTGRGAVEVSLSGVASDSALARQIAGAARVTLAAYRREQRELIADVVPADAEGPTPPVLAQFRAALDASPVRGESPDGFIEVRRDDRGEIEVTVAPGTVGRLSPARLEAEVRGALVAAVGDYSRTSDRLFERWIGPVG
jgi:hypothetical protein